MFPNEDGRLKVVAIMLIMTTYVLLWCTVVLLAPPSESRTRVVDLTHLISNRTLYWPGIPRFGFSILYRGIQQGHWFESNWFSTSEHGGTHLDAPAHLYKGHNRVHLVPPERLIGPGVVIDVTSKVAKNQDYQVQLEDVFAWERSYGKIPDGAIVMMNSGWGKRYPIKPSVLNSNSNDPATFHYPGWHLDTANWILQNRKVIVIGTDTPSNDFGQSPDFVVHQTLGRHNVSGLENIANLNKLPPRGMLVFVGVPKIYDGSGGPARVFALINYRPSRCSCPRAHYRYGRSVHMRSSGSSPILFSNLTYIILYTYLLLAMITY